MVRDRVILHCDLNNFYASVACHDNPSLIGMPVAVAGSVENRHGIVLAKNYIAKDYGIKTGDTIREAEEKCGSIIFVPPNFKRQKELSLAVHKIYLRYTDMVEPFGVDECWLDVTGSARLFGDGEKIANDIRKTVKRETGLTISVGVSFNKIFAKLGSDMKKPDAVTVISKENFKEKIWNLPASDLFGVGRRMEGKLRSFGVFTIGDLALCNEQAMNKIFGKFGVTIRSYANGEADATVDEYEKMVAPKSVGRSSTASHDITTEEEAWKQFLLFSEEIAFELNRWSLNAKGVQIHTRTKDLVVKEYEAALDRPTSVSGILAEKGLELLKKHGGITTPLRSIGIRAIRLTEDCEFQQGIFDDIKAIERLKTTDEELFSIREKFGNDSIFRARTGK